MMNELSFLDSLFDNFDGVYGGNYRGSYVPKVDVKETKDAYTLDMDLPGRNEGDVDIQLDRNVLTISSKNTEKIEKKAEKCDEHDAGKNNKNGKDEKCEKADEPKWLIRERKVCGFSRSFSLPNDANGEEISAAFKNGVLTVVIPRKAVNVPKRIQIKVA